MVERVLKVCDLLTGVRNDKLIVGKHLSAKWPHVVFKEFVFQDESCDCKYGFFLTMHGFVHILSFFFLFFLKVI